MKNSLFFGILVSIVTFLHGQPVVSSNSPQIDKNFYTSKDKNETSSTQSGRDDWNSSWKDALFENEIKKWGGRRLSIQATPTKGMALGMMPRKIGLTTGGAKDIGNFEENLKRGYLPLPTSITYTGTFYQHYFQLPSGKCMDLFCPAYTTARDHQPFTKTPRYFLMVGLDSNLTTDAIVHRPPLNLVIVLDISGSMSSPLTQYYYDFHFPKGGKEESAPLPKIRVATSVLGEVLKKLRPSDRVAIVLFNHRAGVAKPLNLVGETDIPAIVNHLQEVSANGGTNWEAGYRVALSLFQKLPSDQLKGHENRILFLTDAMPNTGATSKKELLGMIKDAGKKGIYTTFVGVGLDFNTNLVNFLGQVRGANYFFIKSPQEFKRRLAQEFDYWVTPLVFDLKMELEGKNFQIVGVYGTPTPTTSKTLISIPTLFPSPTNQKGTKGGVILVELKPTSSQSQKGYLVISFEDREGKNHRAVSQFQFKPGFYYGDNSIRKAILLTDFVKLLKGWLVEENKKCSRVPNFCKKYYRLSKCPPIEELYPYIEPVSLPSRSQWEISSCKLAVNSESCKAFSKFLPHFRKEMKEIGDRSLRREEKILMELNRVCHLPPARK
jgi:Ca-activated chloride channel family protein